MVKLADEVRIIDADTHMTERHDLFTSRAPKGYEQRVPRVVDPLSLARLETKRARIPKRSRRNFPKAPANFRDPLPAPRFFPVPVSMPRAGFGA